MSSRWVCLEAPQQETNMAVFCRLTESRVIWVLNSARCVLRFFFLSLWFCSSTDGVPPKFEPVAMRDLVGVSG
jgi:hypothetical protein